MVDYPDIQIKADFNIPAPMPPAGGLLTPVSPASVVQPANSYSFGAAPAMMYGMNFQDIGQTGLRQFSGWVREEFLPQLIGRQGAQKYREMMDNNPIIGAIMFAITSTMRKVQWRVNPANDSPAAAEQAEFVEGCMHDMSHSWEDLIVENLSMLGYGFAPHELVYKRRLGYAPGQYGGQDLPSSDFDDGAIGWRRIPIRGQDTIIKWFFDQSGGVTGITQQPWVGPIVDIPIQKMLLFRPSAHKNNPEGRSILRTAFRPYWFIKRLEEQEAILFERMNGIPVIKVPGALLEAAQAGDAKAVAAVTAYKKMAVNIRVDEQMGLVMPSDVYPGNTGPSSVPMYGFELVTPNSGGKGQVSANETILRYQTQILSSVLADFISMGHDTRGAQNLGETKADLFYLAIEGFLNSMAAVYNRHAIPRLWDLNGFDRALMPEIVPDLAQRVDLDVLSNFVLRMSQSGMPLFPDEELQTYLREAAGLPDVTEAAALLSAGLTDDQLARDEQMADASLDQTLNPPDPAQPGKPKTPLEKMLLGSLARRMIRKAGPRFGIETRPRRRAALTPPTRKRLLGY